MIKWCAIFLMIIPSTLFSQVQENDWINYNQSYFKFSIYRDGIHRITYNDLLNAGINVNALNPKNIQIFARGVEEYIYIQGEGDGKFNTNDYIEFHGTHNDGFYDSSLFKLPEHQGNPDYSMFTDTISYFLTWGNSLGKRITVETDVNFVGYTPAPYFLNEVKVIQNKAFSSGQLTVFNWAVPEYSSGEGWGGTNFGHGSSTLVKAPTPNPYLAGPNSVVKAGLAGKTSNTHVIQPQVGALNMSKYTFYSYEMLNVEFDFVSTLLSSTTDVYFRSLVESGNPNERIGLMNFTIEYPSQFLLEGKSEHYMTIPSGGVSKDFLSITDFDNLNSSVYLYDLTHHKKIVVQASSGVYRALLPNQGVNRKCLLTCDAAVKSVGKIRPVSGQSPLFIDYKTLSSQKGGANYFIVTAPKLESAANEYATYRDLKGFKSMVVDIEQLYDQYSFGIRKHPMSIRNFMLEATQEWVDSPEYLLLLGKSVTASSSRGASTFELNMVPTWGVQGADIGFTNGVFGQTVLEPLVPTGRIAATTENQVLIYLNKIKEYESAEKNRWMKNVLHFGGGQNVSEQLTFKNYLNQYQTIIEKPSFGGKVHTFLKSSSDPLQINLSDSVTNLINNGVSLMTFFGHAYANNFDQSIDEPENYSNRGKYGFIVANSCLIGNIHTTNTQSGSERFVLADGKGTIGFLGSSSLGVPSYLNTYTKSFYTQLSQNSYGQSIGKIIQQTVRNIQDSINVLNRDVCMYMTLHGDPAVVINAHEKPDYSLYGGAQSTSPKVFFNPNEVTNEVDSFDIFIVINNLGKAQYDTLDLRITRKFPTTKDTTYNLAVTGVFYQDTVVVRMPVNIADAVGVNVFEISIDPLGLIDELTTINNTATVNLLIQSSEILPVYPFEFAVVPNQFPVLKASTGSAYAPLTSYVFQIDTTENFDSSMLLEETISSFGGVVEWNPRNSISLNSFFGSFPANTTLQSPTVFYWRVRPVLNSGKILWKGSSFQYVQDKEGWGQSHFQQFKKNSFQFLDYDYDKRDYSFVEQIKEIDCTVHASPNLPYRWGTKYKIDGAIVCQNSTQWGSFLFIAVIDKLTLLPWHVKSQGPRGHSNYNDKVVETWNQENFYFSSSNAISSVVSFLEHVPDSNYILIYHFLSHQLPRWYNSTSSSGIDLTNLMSSMGADIDRMKAYTNNAPYIFFTQKGDPSKTKEMFSSGESLIQLKADMRNNWVDGTMFSTSVGKAQSWGSFHWELENGEVGNSLDSNKISLFGVDQSGAKVKFLDTLSNTGDLNDLSFIDVQQYSNLELSVYLSDDSLRTPKKLKRWQVLYQELPELALNPSRLTNYNLNDTVQEGEDVVFTTVIENIGKYDVDSIQIVYWLLDANLNIKEKTFKNIAPLEVGEFIVDSVRFSTLGLEGMASIWYEVNPYDGVKPWMPEQHHFNNINLSQFFIQRDEINPLLDVTFDGIHILNGDIVSPEPYIVITLDDENQYLALNDPSLIQLFLSYPNTSQDSLVLLDPTTYTFSAGEMPKNQAKIEFQGNFPQDGIYELHVMSQDRSKNISGKGDGIFDYSIKFEVVNESSITQVMNWPNPFSTSTQFVFTLTGAHVPERFLIQIITISGKIVREIDKDEFGPINIGRNISDFRWDGKDQYGDQLANGVYLYRVIVHSGDQDFKERTVNVSDQNGTSTLKDKFFTKGFGKMYLLR